MNLLTKTKTEKSAGMGRNKNGKIRNGTKWKRENKKNEMKRFRNRFDHRIAVDWMHRHGATISDAVFRYFV